MASCLYNVSNPDCGQSGLPIGLSPRIGFIPYIGSASSPLHWRHFESPWLHMDKEWTEGEFQWKLKKSEEFQWKLHVHGLDPHLL